jgi:hypothetical protein
MALQAQRARRGFKIRGSLLLPLLAVTVLVPTAILFTQARDVQSEKESFAKSERNGVEYLRSLYQLTTALMDAESAAVAGTKVPTDALNRAVAATTAVDERLGNDLRTRDRWASLQAKLAALPSINGKDGETVYANYGEAANLLLSLYGKVRENSELIRDPDADSYFLEDAAAEELPQSVIAASRLTDLAVIAPKRPDAQKVSTIGDLAGAKGDVTSPVGDLTEDLNAAVTGTSSSSLSGNLLSRLDLYQRTMDKLVAATAPLGDGSATVDTKTLSGLRSDVQDAGTDLSGALYTELDDLIGNRLDDLAGQRRTSYLAMIAAILLALAAIATSVLYGRRQRRATPQPAPASAGQPAIGGLAAEAPGLHRGVSPGWPDAGPGNTPGLDPGITYPVAPDIDRGVPTGWERSGAAR